MTPLDRGLGAVLGAAALAGVVWTSNAPMTAHRAPDAVLRLAWSARPERIETCRQQSEEELARLPQHMRQAIVCEGTTAEYRLQVRHEGDVIADQVVRGGGLRQDRRLYVFQDLPLPAGEAVIDVRFDRVDADAPVSAAADRGDDARRAGEASRQQHGETVPPHLSLEKRLRMVPREVVLVTYDPERHELVAVQRALRTDR